MSILARVSIILAVVAVASLTVAALIAARTFHEWDPAYNEEWQQAKFVTPVDEGQSVSSRGVSTITVNSTLTQINVSESQGDTIDIHHVGTVYSNDLESVPHLKVEQRGETVRIWLEQQQGGNNRYRGEKSRLDVAVPARYVGALRVESSNGGIWIGEHRYRQLTVQTTSGSVHLESMRIGDERQGEVVVHTNSGMVEADDLTAASIALASVSGMVRANVLIARKVHVSTSSGRVELEQVVTNDGDLVVEATSGVIKVNEALAKTITLSTVSGEITAASISAEQSRATSISGTVILDRVAGELSGNTTSGTFTATFAAVPKLIDVTAVSGDVELALPANAQFAVQADTTSGAIDSAFAITAPPGKTNDDNRVTGTVGQGGGLIKAHTTSGNITLRIAKDPRIED